MKATKSDSTFAWIVLILLGIMVLIVAKQLFFRDYLEVESEKCYDVMVGDNEAYGYVGDCETYIGSDGKLHYKYVRHHIEEGLDRDFYFKWETMERGEY